MDCYARARLQQMHPPITESSPCSRALADFRLHVVWELGGEQIFVGSARLDECIGFYDDQMCGEFVLKNLVDVFGSPRIARLVGEGAVADAGLAGIADMYWGNADMYPSSTVRALISRSDGAVACLATGGGYCTQVVEDAFEFDFEDCVLGSLCSGSGDGDDDGLQPRGFAFCLDEVTEYGPGHVLWNETTMRAQYEEARRAQRRDWESDGDSVNEDDEEDDDEEEEPDDDDLEDLIAIVPSHVCMRWTSHGEGGQEVTEDEIIESLMRLVWVLPASG